MARQITVTDTTDGKRYRVRYRRGTTETSETFRRLDDAKMFRDILGDSRGDRVTEALAWLASKDTAAQTATFGAWFETWANQLTGITARTKADYQAMHRRYLTELDPLPLPMVSRAHVARIVNRMETQGLSAKTIKNTFHMLATVMAVAQDDGLIPRNPVKRVRLPKVTRPDSEYLFLTHEEAGTLIAATAEHYRPLVTFLFGTGLRWSEATALQVRHVDQENGTVRVDRAWKRVPGGFEIGSPKSEKSRRTVNAAVPALYAAAAHIEGRKSTDLLFTTPGGVVVRHSNFYNRIWVPACEAAGLANPRPSPKDCRSTFGSWLISEGIGLEAVQDQLGHESYETTRRIYAHLLPAVGVAAGKAASAALARALGSTDVMQLGVGTLEPGGDPQ